MEVLWDRLYIERDELYDLIWSEATFRIAARLGVSDVALAKLCKRLNVPKPPMGYWAKLAHGKTARKIPLPTAKKGDPTQGSLPHRAPKDLESQIQTKAYAQAEIEKGLRIIVSSELDDPDPLLIRIISALPTAKISSSGYLRSTRSSFPDISISPGTKDRALLILDSLIKAIRARGFSIALKEHFEVGTPSGPVTFTIRESINKVDREQTLAEAREEASRLRWRSTYSIISGINDAYKPKKYKQEVLSGRLMLTITSHRMSADRCTWSESSNRPLENQLNSFIVGLVRFAENQAIELERRERARILEEQREREREEYRERERIERKKRNRLWYRIENLERSERIRHFADAIELTESDGRRLTDEAKEYVEWIRTYADYLDPLKSTPVSLSVNLWVGGEGSPIYSDIDPDRRFDLD